MKKSNFKFAAFAAMLVLLISTTTIYTGCKKESDPETIAPDYVEQEGLKPNVSIIDPADATLISDDIELSQGIYKF